MTETAQKFYELFKGSSRAHGTFEVNNTNDIKQKGVGKTIRSGGAEIKHWISHLEGDYGLGVIPINEDNKVCWGCIDVDVYPLEFKHLVGLVENLKFPLVVCRSKSGGAHIFLFTKDFVPAGEMQDVLRELSAALGYGGVEIFPKQREILVDRSDVGSWLNMPYFGGNDSTRYGYDNNGMHLNSEAFLEFVEKRKITREKLWQDVQDKPAQRGELTLPLQLLKEAAKGGYPPPAFGPKNGGGYPDMGPSRFCSHPPRRSASGLEEMGAWITVNIIISCASILVTLFCSTKIHGGRSVQ